MEKWGMKEYLATTVICSLFLGCVSTLLVFASMLGEEALPISSLITGIILLVGLSALLVYASIKILNVYNK